MFASAGRIVLDGLDRAPRQASQILPKAGVLEQMDEFAQGRGEIRLEFQRPPEATDRFGKLALVSQGIAKVVVSLGKIRPFVEWRR